MLENFLQQNQENNAHSGEFLIESNAESGTTITVKLPMLNYINTNDSCKYI
jgi:hypothetical protein